MKYDPNRKLQAALTVRGDSVYCPLAFSLDSYFNCLTDCHHCYFRHLNRTWGQDLRPADPEDVARKLCNGLKNPFPKTPLASCMALKKTIRFGNKTDPFQRCETEYHVSRQLLQVLIDGRWTFVIQTRFLDVLGTCEQLIAEAEEQGLVTIMPVISPGGEMDWTTFERERTPTMECRFAWIHHFLQMGVPVGVNGEPFIPGYHTEHDFEEMLKRLKAAGVSSYNVYNLHFNDHVAKRFADLGLDIMKIWTMNQDTQWRPILQRLLDIGKKLNMRVGCPDFVNSGPDRREPANTCCGIDVPNPCRFNTHFWKRLRQKGNTDEVILKKTWDGIGDLEEGKKILTGTRTGFYTLKDAGL